MGEDKKEEEENPEIVLKVEMHCEACARKVARTLKGFQGVEAVDTDSKANKVVVKGKTANPTKVYERLLKKYGRKVELVSPLPPPPPPLPPAEEENKEEDKESKPKEEKKEEPPPPPPPPAVLTVVLKVGMHCEACAQLLRKRIRKIKGVESVETDVGNDQVTVKGTVDPAKLVTYVYKRTRKQATVVKGEEKKEEEKKEEKKEEETKKESEEETKVGEKDDKQSEDMKRSEYLPSKYYSEFEYPPQFFSDENPNACSLM